MGYAISWLAVRQKDELEALAALGLASTTLFEDNPDPCHPWYSARTAAGWTVIWSNLYSPDHFSRFVQTHPDDVIVCDVEEHVMAVCLEAYRAGELLWRVEHDAQEGPEHLYVEGGPPSEFGPIRDEVLSTPREPDVDLVFEIPVRLGEALVGLRHDAGEHRFEVLRPAAPPPVKPWWKIW